MYVGKSRELARDPLERQAGKHYGSEYPRIHSLLCEYAEKRRCVFMFLSVSLSAGDVDDT
jgi:hypothetical protein